MHVSKCVWQQLWALRASIKQEHRADPSFQGFCCTAAGGGVIEAFLYSHKEKQMLTNSQLQQREEI